MLITCWNCNQEKEHYAHMVCRKCYRKLSKESYKRYQLHKDDPHFKEVKSINEKRHIQKLRDSGKIHEVWRKAHIRYISNPDHKKKKAEYDKKWRTEINPDAYKAIVKRHNHKRYFNRMNELVLKRDGFKCFICGITQEEHFRKFGTDLSIHHIDGKGRNTPKELKNNDINNLVALCKSCHGKVELGSLHLQPLS